MYHIPAFRFIRLAIMASLFITFNSQAQVCRVSTSGTSNASGASWQQTKSLTSALSVAAVCPEIWVKSGTYYPTLGTDRSISFSVKPGVKLYGGFYGTETALVQRDYLYNKATLSGDIGVSVLATDNSYHVVYLDGNTGAGIDQQTIIDGFIISDGYADTQDGLNFIGGGLLCDANGSNTECSPLLRHLIFSDNLALNGGALYNRGFAGGESSPTIENVVFTNNMTKPDFQFGSGGAVYNDGFTGISSPTFINTVFDNNSAVATGGAMANYGSSGASNPQVLMTTFTGNSAKKGGAVYNDGSNLGLSNSTYINSTFQNNLSQQQGGAIYNRAATINLNQITVAENAAQISGGGVYNEDSNTTIRNSILWANQAPSGAQLYNDNSQITATYNVIQNNCAGFGNGGGGTQNCSNILTGNPQLGSLQINRGFTQTMMPGVGSSAIDSGDNINCTATDQRGVERPQNGQCDMGSVEVLSICRVTTSGSTVGNGSNWSGQAMTLQTALNTPTCHQVWIKTGTYKPTTSNDRSVSFNVQPKTTVLGGFAGTETNPNDRNVASNPVILSGDIGITNNMTDNSYHVVNLDGTQGVKILSTTVIADLEIHNGFGDPNFFGFPNNSGAGLFCDGSGTGSACNPFLSNVRFVNNRATGGSGGGMFNEADDNGESSPQMINVIFDSNSAINGGAIYNNGSNGGTSSPVVINGALFDNSANNSGGAVYNNANGGISRSQFIFGQFSFNDADYGGAVYNSGQSFGINTASFNQVTFINNQASFNGGALYSAGWNNGMSKPTIQDVGFELNSAQRGGAVYLNDLAGNGTADFNRVTFNQNLATEGGALYNDGENGYSHPTLTNVTFNNNAAFSNGGAIYNNGDNGASSPVITNATFSGNNANFGGAMYSSADPSGTSSSVMRHVIMWDNVATGDGATIYHNLAESNLFDSVVEFGCPTFGFGNAVCNNVNNSDPMLGALGNNGGYTQTLLPATGSSVIDAGNNLYCPGEDQRGESRPDGAACDIGAVEVTAPGSSDVIFKNGFD